MVWRERLIRARSVLVRDGPRALVLAASRRYVCDRREFFLYQHHHRDWPETDFHPRLDGFDECFVSGNAQADEQSRKRHDFRRKVLPARRALDSGAVAFCIYLGPTLVHIAWLATSCEGRRALDRLGYDVRFAEGEAWTGAAWTEPSYRGRGLLTYSCYRRFECLLQSGWASSRGAVETGNLVSHRATMRFEPHVYAIGWQWRVLGWRWWSEREYTG